MDPWCPGFAGKQLHACSDTTRGTSAEEGRGGYCWEVFGGNSTYTGRFVVQVVVCIFAINEGIPSGFGQGGASDRRCGGVSFRVLRIPAADEFSGVLWMSHASSC